MWSLWRNKSTSKEADKAVESAARNLRAAERRGPEVTRVSEALQEFYDRNHFAEKLEELIIRHKGPQHDT